MSYDGAAPNDRNCWRAEHLKPQSTEGFASREAGAAAVFPQGNDCYAGHA